MTSKLAKAIARLSRPTEESRHYAFTPVATEDLRLVLDAARRTEELERRIWLARLCLNYGQRGCYADQQALAGDVLLSLDGRDKPRRPTKKARRK